MQKCMRSAGRSTLTSKFNKIQGGIFRSNFTVWTIIISDKFILNIIQQGLNICFAGDISTNMSFEYKRSHLE